MADLLTTAVPLLKAVFHTRRPSIETLTSLARREESVPTVGQAYDRIRYTGPLSSESLAITCDSVFDTRLLPSRKRLVSRIPAPCISSTLNSGRPVPS